MLKGFKDFLVRGNVVDLAVAVVIGAAFTAVVNAFAADFLTPLIGLAGGGGSLGGQLVVHGQAFKWGAFLSQLITFVITAAVVYFAVVLPMHMLMDRRRRGVEPGPSEPTQTELLAEIRDLLRAQQGGAALPVPAGGGAARATVPGAVQDSGHGSIQGSAQGSAEGPVRPQDQPPPPSKPPAQQPQPQHRHLPPVPPRRDG